MEPPYQSRQDHHPLEVHPKTSAPHISLLIHAVTVLVSYFATLPIHSTSGLLFLGGPSREAVAWSIAIDTFIITHTLHQCAPRIVGKRSPCTDNRDICTHAYLDVCTDLRLCRDNSAEIFGRIYTPRQSSARFPIGGEEMTRQRYGGYEYALTAMSTRICGCVETIPAEIFGCNYTPGHRSPRL